MVARRPQNWKIVENVATFWCFWSPCSPPPKSGKGEAILQSPIVVGHFQLNFQYQILISTTLPGHCGVPMQQARYKLKEHKRSILLILLKINSFIQTQCKTIALIHFLCFLEVGLPSCLISGDDSSQSRKKMSLQRFRCVFLKLQGMTLILRTLIVFKLTAWPRSSQWN